MFLFYQFDEVNLFDKIKGQREQIVFKNFLKSNAFMFIKLSTNYDIQDNYIIIYYEWLLIYNIFIVCLDVKQNLLYRIWVKRENMFFGKIEDPNQSNFAIGRRD